MKCAGVRHRQTVSCKATSCSKLPGWELMTVCFSNSYCWHAKSFSSTLSSSKYKRRSYVHTDLFIYVYLCLYIVNIFFLCLVRLVYFAFLASWVNLLWFMMCNICVKPLKSFWASLYVLPYMVMDELLLVICSGKIDTCIICNHVVCEGSRSARSFYFKRFLSGSVISMTTNVVPGNGATTFCWIQNNKGTMIIAAFVVFITHQQQNRYCTNKSVLEICSNRHKSGKSVFKNRVKPCYTLQLHATFSKPIRQRKWKFPWKITPVLSLPPVATRWLSLRQKASWESPSPTPVRPSNLPRL